MAPVAYARRRGRLQARIGIATGLVVVGDLVGEGAAQEEAVVGDTPNLAARLQAAAEPGTVVIAEVDPPPARRRIRAATTSEPQTFKGIQGPTAAFAVLGERALESRFAGAAGRRRGADRRPRPGTRACCWSAGDRPEAARVRWCCSPARPASASRASPKPWSRRLDGEPHLSAALPMLALSTLNSRSTRSSSSSLFAAGFAAEDSTDRAAGPARGTARPRQR